jgi:membrane-bound serine protease (ClpP class)
VVHIVVLHPLGWLVALLVLGCVAAGVRHVYQVAGATAAWFAGGGAVVLVAVLCYVGLKVLPRTSWGRGLVLEEDDDGAPPPAIQVAQNPGEGGTREDLHRPLLGKHGVATTPLRPAGVALIGEERVDVVTEGERIDAGSRIKVIAVAGNRVVVRRVQV